MGQTLLDLRDNLIRNMDEGQPNTFIREAARRLWNLALEVAEQEAKKLYQEYQREEAARDFKERSYYFMAIGAGEACLRIRKLKE